MAGRLFVNGVHVLSSPVVIGGATISGDVTMADALTVAGLTTLDGDLALLDNVDQRWGTGTDCQVRFSTNQSNHALVFGIDTASMTFILCESADRAQNFGLAAQSDPTLCIQSADHTTPGERVLINHHALIIGVDPFTIGDGGVTHYAEFAPDGELTLHGTARVLKKDRIWAAELGKGSTAPDESIVDNFTIQSYDINDDSVFQWEVPADWASSTNVTVHLHWACNEAYALANGEVQWEIAWRAIGAGEAYDAGGATGTIDSGDINIATNAREAIHSDLGVIPGGSLAVDDVVGMTFKRVALDGGVDPTADPEVLVVAMVYTRDKLGLAT